MKTEIQILRSKLIRPDISHTILRKRLLDSYRRLPRHRLTLVVAGAGYGKTTFASQAVSFLDIPAVWYRLDRDDRDAAVFFRYLVAGMKQLKPDRNPDPPQSPIVDPALDVTVHIKRLVAELESRVSGDTLIVLDDFHLIGESPEVHGIIHGLLDHLPLFFHLVIISRRQPGLALSRLRAQRRIFDIGETDLTFTRPETGRLFDLLIKAPVEDTILAGLWEKTRGWAAGLILFHYRLRHQPGSPLVLPEQVDVKESIFPFFEENVYTLLPPDTREFLMTLSILSPVCGDVATRLSGAPDAGERLNRMVREHLFVSRDNAAEQVFHFHSLWQDFLLNRLTRTRDARDVRRLHARAAGIYEGLGEPESAMAHYFEAGMTGDACRIFSRVGRQLFLFGCHSRIDDHLKKIPSALLADNPWLGYVMGMQKEISGQFEAALAVYREAGETFAARGEESGQISCQVNQARIFYVLGDFKASENQYKTLVKTAAIQPIQHVEFLCYLLFMAAYCGRLADADGYYADARARLSRVDDPRKAAGARCHLNINLGFRHLFEGNAAGAQDLAVHTLEMIRETPYDKLLILACHLSASALLRMGDYDAGLASGKKGIDIARAKGFRDGSLGFTLLGVARNYIGLGRTDDALVCAGESLELFRRMGSPYGQSSALLEAAAARCRNAQLDQARDAVSRGLARIQGLDLPLLRADLLNLKARILGSPEDAEAARDIAGHSRWHRCQSDLLLAKCHFKNHRPQKGAARLAQAMASCEKGGYKDLIPAEKDWLAPYLASAPFTRKDKSRAAAVIRQIRDQAEPIHATLLGQFSLKTGNRDVPASAWKSKKADVLFKYLLLHHARGFINKEILMELLWPEADPGKSAKRFHVVLASLRKTLEPDIYRGQRSAYIQSRNDAYRIDIKPGGDIDTARFDRCVDAGRDALETDTDRALVCFLEAESLYTGDFLALDSLEEWCVRPRRRFRERYMECLRHILDICEIRQETDRAVTYAKRYLVRDDCAEDIYRKLMMLYAGQGNLVAVARTYETCRQTITRKMDLPLSRATETLFHRLTSPLVEN